jgi:hypothetical protein
MIFFVGHHFSRFLTGPLLNFLRITPLFQKSLPWRNDRVRDFEHQINKKAYHALNNFPSMLLSSEDYPAFGGMITLGEVVHQTKIRMLRHALFLFPLFAFESYAFNARGEIKKP